MRQLRQVFPIQAQLQLEGDRGGELQLVQDRVSQQGGVLQRSKDRRELRIGQPRVDRGAAVVDRQTPAKGKLQEQSEKNQEEEIWQRRRNFRAPEKQGEGGEGEGEGSRRAVDR